MKIEYLKYVPLYAVGDWLFAGWTIVNDLAFTHHGTFSVLMKWDREGEPK